MTAPRVMLDTNICIYLLKKHPAEVRERFERFDIGEVLVSTITVAELEFGLQYSTYSSRNEQQLRVFLQGLIISPFTDLAAAEYGIIKADLTRRGKMIGPLDCLIAGHALALDVTMVTNDESEFARVKELRVENWVKG